MQLNAKYAVVIIIFSTGSTHKVYIMARAVRRETLLWSFVYATLSSSLLGDKSFNTNAIPSRPVSPVARSLSLPP
jgi:hypothetical protein